MYKNLKSITVYWDFLRRLRNNILHFSGGFPQIKTNIKKFRIYSPLNIIRPSKYFVGKFWGIDRRPKTSKKLHGGNMWSIFLSFQVTGIICGVHNTEHFTIQVVHLWCFVLIKFNLQPRILSSYTETSTEGAQNGYHEL